MSKYATTWDDSSAATSRKYPYLRFDAFSFKDLINAKLSEDENFTDHVYPGSNLSILIDCMSELFACLAYNLNNAAAESMMSDTMLTKNLNRLVKFLGYCPAGYRASTVSVEATAASGGSLSFLIVPKYSTITLSDTDSNGSSICFSTTDYFYVNAGSRNTIDLTNGRWFYYNTTFTATGEPYEKFILDQINVADTATQYVAFPYIDVYVKRPLGNNTYKTIYFSASTDGMYIDSSDDSILTSKDNVFSVRLNEYDKYEIQFGDGIHGSKLKSGDVIHVVYLRSNGPDGEINVKDISNKRFSVEISGISNSESTDKSQLTMADIMELTPVYDNSILAYDSVIGEYFEDESKRSKDKEFFYGCTNYVQSASPKTSETVEQIRSNAPSWFKRVGRTITTDDYVSYIKTNFFSDIIDVVVMNNYQYMAKFYKWLWFLGREKLNNPKKWINASLSSCGTYGYKYADAADSNNVYIWIKQNSDSASVGKNIISALQDIKPLTAEPVVLSAVDVNFALCAGYTVQYNDDGTEKTAREFYNKNGNSEDDVFIFNDQGQNRLEVEISSGLNVSASIIKNRVLSIFKNFFSTAYMNLGDTVSVSDLESQILEIDGVKRIRTIFRQIEDDGSYSTTNVVIRNGISLAHWNSTVVNGYDFDITNANVVLEEFQFPNFYDFSTILGQIDVVTNGTSNLTQDDAEY